MRRHRSSPQRLGSLNVSMLFLFSCSTSEQQPARALCHKSTAFSSVHTSEPSWALEKGKYGSCVGQGSCGVLSRTTGTHHDETGPAGARNLFGFHSGDVRSISQNAKSSMTPLLPVIAASPGVWTCQRPRWRSMYEAAGNTN